MVASAAHTIDVLKVHDSLENIFGTAQQQRNEDITKVIRFNDFSEGYSKGEGKIPILKEDKLNRVTEAELDIQISVLIECIEEPTLKDSCRVFFSSLKKKDLNSKETLVNNLIDQNYNFAE